MTALHRASFLLLSEDGSASAIPVLQKITVKLMQLAKSGVQTHQLLFEPQPRHLNRAVNGNQWKGTKEHSHQARVDLVRSIANKLMECDPPGFVVFHFDGDQRWSTTTKPVNAEQFDNLIRTSVKHAILAHLGKNGVAPADVETQSNRHQAKLLVIVPFYSMEAWLYQNTIEAKRLCRDSHCGAHSELFAEWEGNRSLLDEIEKPREQCCLGSKNNEALVSGFPSAEVREVGKSFAQAATTIASCTELLALL